jgi:hypothetical protein
MRYGMTTRLAPADFIARAVRFFGEEMGLEVSERADCCVTLTGAGGHVAITVDAGPAENAVTIETRQWDAEVTKFIHAMAG